MSVVLEGFSDPVLHDSDELSMGKLLKDLQSIRGMKMNRVPSQYPQCRTYVGSVDDEVLKKEFEEHSIHERMAGMAATDLEKFQKAIDSVIDNCYIAGHVRNYARTTKEKVLKELDGVPVNTYEPTHQESKDEEDEDAVLQQAIMMSNADLLLKSNMINS